MKQQKAFNWFKFVTTSMYVIGIGSFLVALLLSGVLWKNVPEEVSKRNHERNSAAIVHDDDNLSQSEPINQSMTEIDTTEIDEMLTWLESMSHEEPTSDENFALDDGFDSDDEFDDVSENSNSEFGLTPEQRQEADSIVQQLHEGTDEYRRLMDIIMTDIPNWTPEFGEQQERARGRLYELDSHLPQLLSEYYFVTRDMDSLERLLPLFEGVMKIELGPGIQEGELFRMSTTPARFLP